MPNPRKPPPTKVEVQPGESPWQALAQELANRPDGPVALGVMSHINKLVRPREKALERLVKAFAKNLEEPNAPGVQADIDLAKANWETVCETELTESLVAKFREDAAELVEKRKTLPPDMSQILLDGADGRRDFGYELGGNLTGLQGTWHRLWALISMNRLLGSDLDDAVPELRAEFERQLGRPLAPVEWDQLVAHAHRHCDVVMRPRYPNGLDGAPV